MQPGCHWCCPSSFLLCWGSNDQAGYHSVSQAVCPSVRKFQLQELLIGLCAHQCQLLERKRHRARFVSRPFFAKLLEHPPYLLIDETRTLLCHGLPDLRREKRHNLGHDNKHCGRQQGHHLSRTESQQLISARLILECLSWSFEVLRTYRPEERKLSRFCLRDHVACHVCNQLVILCTCHGSLPRCGTGRTPFMCGT